MKKPKTVDPMEKIISAGFDAANITYLSEDARNPLMLELDFYLPDQDIHVEVKQFASDTDRASVQLRKTENIILVQGKRAAAVLVNWITSKPENAANEWIDLKTQKPEIGTNVLILCGRGVSKVYDVAVYNGQNPNGSDWWTVTDITIDQSRIAYWAELNLPK